jgi:hypothetical protein
LVSRHFTSSLRSSKLITNPLHVLQQDLLPAAVYDLRGQKVLLEGYGEGSVLS